MLTNTSQLATRALIVLALEQEEGGEPMTPRSLAERLECSPTYLGKTLGLLTKAGLLRSVRGARGGVVLDRSPAEITLLDIVEACQGLVTAAYCRDLGAGDAVCSYHVAMKEIHDATVKSLSAWSLAELLESPARPRRKGTGGCKMTFVGCERHCRDSGEGA